MRTASLRRFGEPLNVSTEIMDPSPAAEEVIIRVHAAGVCRTDLKIIDGAVPTVKTPLVLGHEPAGEVVELGHNVAGVNVGDRVAVSTDITCGRCPYCRIGQPNYCANLRRFGFERDGALADYLAVPAVNLIQLSDNVSYESGATLPDAVGSAYHAVIAVGRVRLAETVAVFGLGGLGLVAVQVAALSGARVMAIARNEERRALAMRFGASETFDPRDGNLSEHLRASSEGLGVHVFLDFVGSEDSTQAAVSSCRTGGRIVVVGYVATEMCAKMTQLVYSQISISGSRGSTHADLVDAETLIAQGGLTPVVGLERNLTDVNSALDELREGSVIGRVVLHP